MGAPTLKAKQELRYRRMTTSKACQYCNHYVHSWPNGADIEGPITIEPRCHIIGLKPGRAYRISPKGLCDRYDNSEYLARLGTNWSKANDCQGKGPV